MIKEELDLLPKDQSQTILVIGSVVLLFGASMVLSWHLYHFKTLSFLFQRTPMSYTTSLGFVLSGLGFLMLWKKRRKLVLGIGTLLLLLSITTLVLYLLGNTTSLDGYLLQLGLIGGQTFPRPIVAPQTATCFGLISLILLTNLQALTTGIFGAFVFGLGLVTTTSYIVSWNSVQDWGLLSQMSLPAALNFTILGIGLIRLSWLGDRIVRTQDYLELNKQFMAEVEERKQTAEALEQSEEHYYAFLEAIPDVMFRIHNDGTFLDYWVPETSEFGQSSGAFVGTPIQDFMPDSLTRRMLQHLEKALQTRHIQTFEFQWPSAGEMLTFEARVTRSGEAEGIFIIRDITEQLRLSEALGKKNKDLEALLYIISHDLNEPMRTIKSFSRILSRRCKEQLDEKGQDLLTRIDGATERLEQLLDDLLQYSRAQRFERGVHDISSAEIVEKVCERLKHVIQKTGATIAIAPDLPHIQANPTWATQAVYNLVANALKYTEQGQPPDLEIARYQQVKTGGMVDVGLVIRDRGIGVPADLEEYIFQLFQRAAGREYEGTGAGLSIVRQVAERHGGNAWVQARKGGGSEFFITFGVRSLLPNAPHLLSKTPTSELPQAQPPTPTTPHNPYEK